MVNDPTNLGAEMSDGAPIVGADRPIILCFVAYYLPGYRSGGPVRTIANFVDHLGDEFDIRIITRDRDALDTEPYPDVAIEEWNTVGKARVFYASDQTLTLRGIARLLRETPHDILYLNSFFSFRFTTLPVLARRLGMAPKRPCVIAPRGEFSQGALEIKGTRKSFYLWLARFLKIHHGVLWQASNEFEAKDIYTALPFARGSIAEASNLPSEGRVPSPRTRKVKKDKDEPLRLIFLSRVSPKKNLNFLLSVLKNAEFSVELDIYGVIDDEQHWDSCKALITMLPSSASVRYQGVVPHMKVNRIIASYDLFVLPTRGENYGHAIAEALSQGVPVLISDQTPWRDLEMHGAGWDLSLDRKDRFLEVLAQVNAMDEAEYLALRESAVTYAKSKLMDGSILEKNRKIFHQAYRSRDRS